MAKQTFSKDERIKTKADFLNVYKNGVKIKTEHFRIAVLPNNLRSRRLGITVSRKVGNAVVRNYVKRCLREYFRLNKELFPSFCDIVIKAWTGAGLLKFAQICAELKIVAWKEIVKGS